MFKKVFNYFATDVKRSWGSPKKFLLGTEDLRNRGGDFTGFIEDMVNPPGARAAIMADRAVTLTASFATVAAFAFSPAIIAIPAIAGLLVVSRFAGYVTAAGVDAGVKKIQKKFEF